MNTQSSPRPVSGHVFKVKRKSGLVWYAKYRLPDGRQEQKKVGPHWSEKSAPPDGYFTRDGARRWLDETLAKARRNELPGQVRTDVTYAEGLDLWLDYKKGRVEKSTWATMRGQVGKIKRWFNEEYGAELKLEKVTQAMLEAHRDQLVDDGLTDTTVNKYLILQGDFFGWSKKKYKLPVDPMEDVERRETTKAAPLLVYGKEEVERLVAAARELGNDQDAVLFLTAAMAGLRRGELLGLRWRDIKWGDASIWVRDNWVQGETKRPKSKIDRVVPMAPEVATALTGLRRREEHTGDDDLVFVGRGGEHVGVNQLGKRYIKARERAGLRPLEMKKLRNSFGTVNARKSDPFELAEWMGHADPKTTRIYYQQRPRHDAARRMAEAWDDDAEQSAAA